MSNFPFLFTTLITVFYMRRGGYGWLGCILTGIFASPLIYICLFAMINLGANIVLGVFKVSEASISDEAVFIGSTTAVLVLWLISGILLSNSSKKNKTVQQDATSNVTKKE